MKWFLFHSPLTNLRAIVVVCSISLSFAVTVSAHEGPPFPLLVDQKIDHYVISVWTDPDVGTGTFFVIVNSADATPVPNNLKVQIGVQPVSSRLAEVFYDGQREDLRGQIQYKVLVQFDAQEMWKVRVRLQSPQGSGETVATVEATPPGYGRWDLLIYLTPFLAIGFLWLVAVVRRRRSPISRKATRAPAKSNS